MQIGDTVWHKKTGKCGTIVGYAIVFGYQMYKVLWEGYNVSTWHRWGELEQ